MPSFVRAIALVVALTGCSTSALTSPTIAPDGPAPDHEQPYVTNTVPSVFSQAVSTETVPLEVLVGIAKAESGVQMVTGEEEFEGKEARHGIMGLRDGLLETAADLAGVTVEQIKTDPVTNVTATATLLAEWAAEEGIDPADLNAWAPVVARYSGIQDEEGIREYVHYEVYNTISDGYKICLLYTSPSPRD